MALQIEALAQIQKDLVSRRASLARELRQATAEMLDEEMNFTDAVDQASQDTDRGIAVQIQNREREILAQIDSALSRIEAGVFGICENCDETISEARLRAQPSTTLCIDCKSEIESQQQKYTGRA